MTPTLLAALTGCVDPPEPPVAHIDFVCLDADCAAIEFSGTESLHADTYRWQIDGVPESTDPTVQIDLPPAGLREVELSVGNDAGTDTQALFAFTTGVVTPEEPEPEPPVSTIVAGVTACNGTAIVATVGGCFTGPMWLRQRVLTTDQAGATTASLLDYERTPDDVTAYGRAVGAAWLNAQGANTLSFGPANGQVGPTSYGPHAPFPSVAKLGQEHLTAYYPVSAGDLLHVELDHLTQVGGLVRRTTDTLELDCTSGGLQVRATTVP